MLRRRPPLLAPLVAFLGLAIIAGGTAFAVQRYDLLGTAAGATATPGFTIDPNATDETFGTYDPNATDDPSATDTPQATDAGPSGGPPPTAFATPPPGEQASIPGTLLYTRGGDLWSVGGTTSTQLLGAGNAFMPVWSPDGSTIYYVQETLQRGKVPPWGANLSPRRPPAVTHLATDIMSIRADGTGKKRCFASMRKEGLGSWSTVAIQPDVSADGKTLVLISDLGTVPTADFDFSPALLSSMSTSCRGLRSLGVDAAIGSYQKPVGHNDPDISPDGKRLAFTYDARRQGQGQPRIGVIRYPIRKTTPDLSPKGRGYANPSWSPDGRYLAAERVTPDKRDVVILDPETWEEVARLTTNGRSFAPVWSPNGDQIAYLHADGLDVNLRVMTLAQGATGPTLELDQAVTVDGAVDPESAPAWFIPPDQRTTLATEAPDASDGAASTAPEDASAP